LTRAQFAEAVGVTEKWVHNAQATLGRPIPYTTKSARLLTVARVIQTALQVTLRQAAALAALALSVGGADVAEFVPSLSESWVIIRVDLPHILSAFAVRLARAQNRLPRRPGRRPSARPGTAADQRRRAREYGVDLTLLGSNLRRTPDERLRALDANARFIDALRRRKRTK
jgi:hypothetical protein